eukprot:3587853-Prymnesium_polylepis.1
MATSATTVHAPLRALPSLRSRTSTAHGKSITATAPRQAPRTTAYTTRHKKPDVGKTPSWRPSRALLHTPRLFSRC